MKKVRIKSRGSQNDFGLVTNFGNVNNFNNSDQTSNVKDTLGAVPKHKANAEVENGEVAIGDINEDGLLEHFTYSGKKHSEGGIPAKLPNGSFIFSNSKDLKIEDKDLLKSYFGQSSKSGKTPAEIAKKYKLNEFIDNLKSEDTDMITKRTSDLMIKNHMEKLGTLALMQESMKGFENGIPEISQSVLAGLQQSEEYKYGGYHQSPEYFQDGGIKVTQEDVLQYYKNKNPNPKPQPKKIEISENGITPDQAKIIYENALKVGTKEALQKAYEFINNSKDSSWYSWGWVPGSNENKFEDYEDRLLKKQEELRIEEARFNASKNYKKSNADLIKTVNNNFAQVEKDFNKMMSNPELFDQKINDDYFKLLKIKNELGQPFRGNSGSVNISGVSKVNNYNNQKTIQKEKVFIPETPDSEYINDEPAPPVNDGRTPSVNNTGQPVMNNNNYTPANNQSKPKTKPKSKLSEQDFNELSNDIAF